MNHIILKMKIRQLGLRTLRDLTLMRLQIFPWTASPHPQLVTFLFAVLLLSKMKKLSRTFIVLATLVLFTCSSSSSTKQVLKLGSTVQNYGMLSPNMGFFTSQFSLSAWIYQTFTGTNYTAGKNQKLAFWMIRNPVIIR